MVESSSWRRLHGIRVATVDIGMTPTRFEALFVRVSVSELVCSVLLVYRPGSKAATGDFFVELADVLDRISILSTSLIVACDFNIRCDRPSDASAIQLMSLFASHGLTCRVS